MIKAKKSLGQNFLIDKNIINKISEITKIENKSMVGKNRSNPTSLIKALNFLDKR